MEIRFSKPDAMIFDIDGTLFKTESVLERAYYKTFAYLQENGLYRKQVPPIEKFYGALGKLLDEIWAEVLPGETEAVRQIASEKLHEYELEGLLQGKGELYGGVAETLKALHRQGIRLFVASNGLEEYVKEVVRSCGIAPYFQKVYSAGEYKTPSKVRLVEMIMEENRLNNAWMIGDRSSDVEAGKANGLVVIGCDYADFKSDGELDRADAVITDFRQLLTLF